MERIEYDNLSTRKKKAIMDAYKAPSPSGIPPAVSRMSFEDFVSNVGSSSDIIADRLAVSPESIQREKAARLKYVADEAADKANPGATREARIRAAVNDQQTWHNSPADIQIEATRRIDAGNAQAKAKSDLDAYEAHADFIQDQDEWRRAGYR